MNRLSLLTVAALLAAGCGTAEVEIDGGAPAPVETDGKNFSSDEATLLDFEFDGELVTTSSLGRRRPGRGPAALHDRPPQRRTGPSAASTRSSSPTSKSEPPAAGQTQVTYHAKLPVAWGSKTNLPTSYELQAAARRQLRGPDGVHHEVQGDAASTGAPTTSTRAACGTTTGPDASGCTLAAADVVTHHRHGDASAPRTRPASTPSTTRSGRTTASRSSPSSASTRTARPPPATPASPRTTSSSRAMKSARSRRAAGHHRPPTVPAAPASRRPTSRSRRTLADGKKVEGHRAARRQRRAPPAPTFDARYEALSTSADLIAYNGHAGLGAERPRARPQGQLGRRQVPDLLHERLRHVRVRRRLARADARRAQPRRPDRHASTWTSSPTRCRRSSARCPTPRWR